MFVKDFEKTAMIYRDSEISYKALKENAEEYTRLINIEKPGKIAIFAENRPEWLYAYFAVWQSGFPTVTIDYLSTVNELVHIFGDCMPEIIFTSALNYEKVMESVTLLSEYKPIIYVFEEIANNRYEKKEKKNNHIKSDDVAVIIYTSGTTGKPKGVMLTYANLLFELEKLDPLEITDGKDRVLLLLPFHHAYPMTATILMPLFKGSTIVFVEKLTSEEILGTMKKHGVTIICAVPRIMDIFHRSIMGKINKSKVASILFKIAVAINNPEISRRIFKKAHEAFGGKVNLIISGGAKLNPKIAFDFKTLGFKVSEGYGLTETAPIIAFNSRNNIKIGTVGRPLGEVKVKIIDDEIVVTGGNVMKGYYNNETETGNVLKDGWFYTGDTGYLDEEGYLVITGRKKELIVLPNGKNINPEEIEGAISEKSDIIKEIAVFEKDSILTALIYPDFDFIKRENVLNIEETIRWGVIDKYNITAKSYMKIMGIIVSNEELPKTRLGKIKRFELEQFVKNRKEKKEQHNAPPQTEEYAILSEYLKELSRRDVFADSHLELDLGLDSLDKVELQYFIEKTFGIEIKQEEIAENPDVIKLTEFVSARKTRIEASHVDWSEVLKERKDIHVSESNILLKIAKFALIPLFKNYFRLDVGGRENLPGTPFILVSNHQSAADAFFIISALKNSLLKNTYFFAKEKHFNGDIQKLVADNSNILIIDINKNLKTALLQLSTVLQKGKNVVIFPEGARTRDGNIMAFKKAFAILAKENNIPVVPFVIKGAYEAFPVGKRMPKRSRIRVRFTKPIYPGEMDYEEITEKTREAIEKEFSRIKI